MTQNNKHDHKNGKIYKTNLKDDIKRVHLKGKACLNKINKMVEEEEKGFQDGTGTHRQAAGAR